MLRLFIVSGHSAIDIGQGEAIAARRLVMRNEKSLNVLTQEQKSKYLKEGYLGLSGLVSQRWLERLRVVTEALLKRVKELTKSDKRFDLEPSHTAEEPRIRRLNSPIDFHEEYWSLLAKAPLLILPKIY